MTNANRYVYGVVRQADFELDVTGVGGANRVYTVDHGPLSAVVSDIDETDPERTDDAATAHDDVLRAVLADGERAVVPMRFGMVFASDRALKNVLRGGRPAFTKALNDVEGCVEMGVKVVSEEDAGLDDDAVREAVRERLDEVSERRAANDLYSDRLLVNDAYLVRAEERAAFDDAVEEVADRYDGDAIVQSTGPWAPYSFVDITIGAAQ